MQLDLELNCVEVKLLGRFGNLLTAGGVTRRVELGKAYFEPAGDVTAGT